MTRKELEEFRDFYAKAGNGLMAGVYQAVLNDLEKKK